MKHKIHDITEPARRFLDEWESGSPYITAHTSGSTGIPKEIKLLKTDMLKSAEATCRYFGIDGSSRMVCPLSADYIAGKMMIVRAIVSGAELWMEEPCNTPLKHDYGHIDLVPVVPSQLPGLLSSDAEIDDVIVGGAPVDALMESTLTDLPTLFYATYGMTETCSHVALRRLGRGDGMYEALPGFSFATDDDSCLVITSGTMSFGRLVTNDVVELIDSARFRWIGRRDNVIISGGLKIFPEEIEKRVRELIPCPFYIVGRPDVKWGSSAVMYVESSEPVDVEKLKTLMGKVLNNYEIPKEILTVASFSYTSSGKIRRLLL